MITVDEGTSAEHVWIAGGYCTDKISIYDGTQVALHPGGVTLPSSMYLMGIAQINADKIIVAATHGCNFVNYDPPGSAGSTPSHVFTRSTSGNSTHPCTVPGGDSECLTGNGVTG